MSIHKYLATFRKTYCLHLQDQAVVFNLLIYQSKQRHIPEALNLSALSLPESKPRISESALRRGNHQVCLDDLPDPYHQRYNHVPNRIVSTVTTALPLQALRVPGG
jgi:hypothetical protein